MLLYMMDIEMLQISITTCVKTYHDGDYLTVGHDELVATGLFTLSFFRICPDLTLSNSLQN